MLGSLLFFVVGPVMVLLGIGFTFFFAAAMWATYHLVKQHYGFMVLYKKRTRTWRRSTTRLTGGCCCSLLTIRSWRLSRATRCDGPRAAIPSQRRQHGDEVVAAGTIVVGGCWLIRQLQRACLRESLNCRSICCWAAAIPMHWIALLTPMPQQADCAGGDSDDLSQPAIPPPDLVS